MKIKTSNLTGAALDWAVALCEGEIFSPLASSCHYFAPSTNWKQGGPIIEREGIAVLRVEDMYLQANDGSYSHIMRWAAERGDCNATSSTEHVQHDLMYQYYEESLIKGPTPLIAAMRCYVASKLGDEIEIPDSLT